MQVTKTCERQNLRIMAERNEISGGESDFREQMLLNNNIEGLLSFEILEIDGRKAYEYKIENMESLELICEKEKLKGEKIADILSNILNVLSGCSGYMLQEADFCLEADSIFFEKNGNVRLAYFPKYGKSIMKQLNQLSDFLMNRVDYRDDTAVVLIYGFYMKTKEANCSVEELLSLVKEKSVKQTNATTNNEMLSQPLNMRFQQDIDASDMHSGTIELTENKELYADTYEGKTTIVDTSLGKSTKPDVHLTELWNLATMSQKLVAASGLLVPLLILAYVVFSGLCTDSRGKLDSLKLFATILVVVVVIFVVEKKIYKEILQKRASIILKHSCEKEEATVFLSMDGAIGEKIKPVTLCSLVSDDSPTINITKFPFFVGADGTHMDFELKKTGVSRRHLKLDNQNGIIAITDLNSTNGTILNGKELLPQTPYSLRRGDKIVIGSCSYYLN